MNAESQIICWTSARRARILAGSRPGPAQRRPPTPWRLAMNRRTALSSLPAFAIAWLPVLLQPAAADPILEIHNNSLTTYLAGTNTDSGQHAGPLVDQRGVNIDGSLRLGGG